jgi:tetratricopeptide (TPR) repeat protein
MRIGSLGTLLVMLTACTRPSVPPFPSVNTSEFAPSIRDEVDKAFAAARAAPQDADKSGRLGMLLHAHDRMDAALTCYERARLLQPKEYKWLYLSGVLHSRRSQNEQAAALFRDALVQRSDDISAQLSLAESLLASGQYAASRASYEKVIEKRPADAIARYGAGRTYASEGNLARAAEFYREACERYPQYAAAHYALGLAYRQLGRTEEAQAHLSQYEKDKNSSPPREDPLLAEVHSMSGGILPLLAKAKTAAAAGRLQEAVDLHQQAMQIDPKQEQIHINLISLYGRLKQFDLAEERYRAAVALNPNRDEAHYNYAVMLTAQGRLPEAIGAYRSTLRINSAHAEAHNNLAYLLARQRKFAEALEHAQKALESRPDYPQAHYNCAMILIERGERDAAIRHLEAAIRSEPNEPRYRQGLAAMQARR